LGRSRVPGFGHELGILGVKFIRRCRQIVALRSQALGLFFDFCGEAVITLADGVCTAASSALVGEFSATVRKREKSGFILA